MRSANGWVACVMAVAIGLFVLGAPPNASATFVLALQEDGGAITPVASGASFGPLSFSGTFGDYTISFFSAAANNLAGGSNLLSSTTEVASTSAGTHTLNLFVANQDYSLPAGPTLNVRSGMGGTYGSEPGFTGAATFRMWADANNGDLFSSLPFNTGTFSNGLQVANPASGNGDTFNTGVDPSGNFARSGLYSLINRASITTTGTGDVNFSTHIRIAAVSVPEPEMPLIMLMVGLLGLFIGVRRTS